MFPVFALKTGNLYIREPQDADSFMEGQKNIMVTHRIGEVPLDSEEGYLAHLLCLEGTCRDHREVTYYADKLCGIRS